LKSPNQKPGVETRSELDLVEAISSHTMGNRKYSSAKISTITVTVRAARDGAMLLGGASTST
jgi:hypothetical protein